MEWQYFPRSRQLPNHLEVLIANVRPSLDAIRDGGNHMVSNKVLAQVAIPLRTLGYQVEDPGPPKIKIIRPVLFGINGNVEKSFEVDAFHEPTGTIIEVEAGRAVVNNQFLKDLFEACTIQSANYLVIMVLSEYKPASKKQSPNRDFKTVVNFIETLYSSGRLELPLDGILVVGY